MDQGRIEALLKLGDEIKMREGRMTDIRPRKWMKSNTRVAKALDLLIQAEDILMDLDDYQMGNDQCYPYLEDFYNQISTTRHNFANYVDEHQELLLIDDEVDAYFHKPNADVNKSSH